MIQKVKVKLNELKNVFALVKSLRAELKKCKEQNEFYRYEIEKYNKEFTKGSSK